MDSGMTWHGPSHVVCGGCSGSRRRPLVPIGPSSASADCFWEERVDLLAVVAVWQLFQFITLGPRQVMASAIRFSMTKTMRAIMEIRTELIMA